MTPELTPMQRRLLAEKVRERFLTGVGDAVQALGGKVQDYLTAQLNVIGAQAENQKRSESWTTYQHQGRAAWLQGVTSAWRDLLTAGSKPAVPSANTLDFDMGGLTLEDEDAVEYKIITSRLVMAVEEGAGNQIDDLQLRIKYLEGLDELGLHDLLRPNVLLLPVVEQWGAAGMPKGSWELVNDLVRQHFAAALKKAASECNEALIANGVLPTINVKDRMKRGATGARVARSPASPAGPAPAPVKPEAAESPDSQPAAPPTSSRPRLFGRGTAAGPDTDQGASSTQPATTTGLTEAGTAYDAGAAHEETRMLTNLGPIGRARARAQGVVGQLRRLLAGQATAGAGEDLVARGASPRLAQAVNQGAERVRTAFAATSGTEIQSFGSADVARVAGRLRQETQALKKEAQTSAEKATIEIVALMFQAILSEERIPASIRVWFARLQMPVLRVALSEPEFFGTLEHPGRRLIDRMGSCVMGFDGNELGGSALEAEIKRIVQVVEQYPETGRRVFQLVHDEFQAFLAKFLTEKDSTQKLITMVQQVEQKETLTIQYTIEMTKLLKEMPVRDEVRDFLFKVWAEAMALVAVRHGVKSAEAAQYKKTASDLVWSAGAKPNRSDRARVIQELPDLLQRLRAGMSLLGLDEAAQKEHIKRISDTLAEAFLSKTQVIPLEKFRAMAERLAHLEEFFQEDEAGEVLPDYHGIEAMLGDEAAKVVVVKSGGTRSTPAMAAWAQELQVGAWFKLDHNGQYVTVQYAWRSPTKRLHLFATVGGQSYLFPSGRVADYLQAGLLLPVEEEALTVRATRDALSKIDANPERLVN